MENIRRILSIDGGGIKGTVPAAFLATVEEVTGKRIVDYFDLIVGTSTGGIVALGLGLNLSASDILNFYEKDGPGIFEQSNSSLSFFEGLVDRFWSGTRIARWAMLPKYNPNALKAALERAFGERLLGESATRLVIPAFDRERREVHVFKTSHHDRFVMDWKQKAVDVALATSAAPGYLPSHWLDNGISLLDGGIWANNPIGLAVVEAISVLRWPSDRIYVLSLGCSEETISIPTNSGVAGLMLKMADVFLLGQSRGSFGTAKLLTGHSESNPKIFRYQHVTAYGSFSLDGTAHIRRLKGIGAAMAREGMPQIKQFFLSSPREEFVPFHGLGTLHN